MIKPFLNAVGYLLLATALSMAGVGLAGVLSLGPALADEPRHELAAGDKVRVTVFGEKELSGEFELDGYGTFAMPLIGPVKALAIDARTLEGRIAGILRDGYLRDPKVNVEVLSLRPIYILGEVNQPGSYPYRAGLSVLNAAAMAGGFTYRADEDDIVVKRGGKGDAKATDLESLVRPGDIIRVKERLF